MSTTLRLLTLACALAGSINAQIVNLGSALPFAVLGGSTVTSIGPTVLVGSLGVSPGSAITGNPTIVGGSVNAADAVAAQAQLAVTTAYNDAASRIAIPLTGDLGGQTLAPGVYSFASSASLTGTLLLDAQGIPGSVWIFQTGTTLTTATASTVAVINGGVACNVFWQVGSSATLGTATTFIGNIMALASITVGTGATNNGGLYARSGAVTLDSNVITHLPCPELPPLVTTTSTTTSTTDTSTTPTTTPPTTTSTPDPTTTTTADSTTSSESTTDSSLTTTTISTTDSTTASSTISDAGTITVSSTTTTADSTTSSTTDSSTTSTTMSTTMSTTASTTSSTTQSTSLSSTASNTTMSTTSSTTSITTSSTASTTSIMATLTSKSTTRSTTWSSTSRTTTSKSTKSRTTKTWPMRPTTIPVKIAVPCTTTTTPKVVTYTKPCTTSTPKAVTYTKPCTTTIPTVCTKGCHHEAYQHHVPAVSHPPSGTPTPCAKCMAPTKEDPGRQSEPNGVVHGPSAVQLPTPTGMVVETTRTPTTGHGAYPPDRSVVTAGAAGVTVKWAGLGLWMSGMMGAMALL